MKTLLQSSILGVALVSSMSLFGQVYDMGGPQSFSTKQPIRVVSEIENMPSFDLEEVKRINEINAANKVGPFMFGYEHSTNYTLNNSGEWTVLANGDRIWRIRIKSAGALSLNFVFNDFFIPAGGHLYLYSPSKDFVLGAYTSQNNNINNDLGTEFIKGDEAVIEYYEPKSVAGQGRLLLGMVVHGYIDINGWYPEKVNESGACNLDVMCPDGSPWANEIRSVARIAAGGGLCTGTLVNNTAQDGTPYFLTANHCNPAGMTSAVFRFNYNSTICGSQTSANSVAPPSNTWAANSINGSVLRATKADSDFGLVELNSTPSAAMNVYYAGWDNSGTTPTTAVGIHHPSGDVKKLAFDDDVLQSAQGLSTVANSEWRIEAWERNTTTEGGSSGSGLWDQNHRIVGQLHGGQATCANSINDYYGKFSMSWTGNGSSNAAQRLQNWLDPANTTTTLDGYDPNNVPAYALDATVQSVTSPSGSYCNNVVTPVVVIKNNGTSTLTSLTISYNVNGGTNQVFNWTGSLATGATANVTLPSFFGPTAGGSHTFNCITSNPNGSADENTSNDNISKVYTSFANAMPMVLNLNLDCYGSETTWEIRPQGSATILFQNPTAYPGSDAAPVAGGTIVTENFCLSNGCYTFEIFDSYGDGLNGAQWSGCGIDGTYNIKDQYNNTFVSMGAADFGNSIEHNFCITTVGINENQGDFAMNLFPNPTNDIINVGLVFGNGSQDLTISLVDVRGSLIENTIVKGASNQYTTSFDLTSLPQGVYFIKVNSESFQSVKKVVKK
jgi:lysyl endopeptidase